MKKIVLLLLLAVFAFAAAGFCGDSGDIGNESSHHCFVCCGAGHCSFISADNASTIPLMTVSKAVVPQDTAYQDLFASGIDHPPQTSL